MGFFDWTKKKNDTQIIDCGPVKLSYSIQVTKSPTYEKIAALHREATTHKKVNWPAAVTCLQKAARLMREHPGNYVIDRWTRLPVFLQQAGRFEEAMQEFDQLLSEVEDRVKQESSDDASSAWIEYIVNLNHQKIYDKMHMVCKRQKNLEDAARYGGLSTQYAARVSELRVIVDQEREVRRLAYERKREGLRT